MSSMRKLKRQVARYWMKKTGITNVNKKMSIYWRDYLRRKK